MIQQQYKKVAQMPEKECVMQFLSLVWSFYKYDEEQFKCSIGVRYNIYIYYFEFGRDRLFQLQCLL